LSEKNNIEGALEKEIWKECCGGGNGKMKEERKKFKICKNAPHQEKKGENGGKKEKMGKKRVSNKKRKLPKQEIPGKECANVLAREKKDREKSGESPRLKGVEFRSHTGARTAPSGRGGTREGESRTEKKEEKKKRTKCEKKG